VTAVGMSGCRREKLGGLITHRGELVLSGGEWRLRGEADRSFPADKMKRGFSQGTREGLVRMRDAGGRNSRGIGRRTNPV